MIEIVDCKCTMFSDSDLPTALRKAADWLIAQKKSINVLEITLAQPDDYTEDWFVNLYW